MIGRVFGISAVVLVASLVPGVSTRAEKAESDVAALFRNSCANCHAVPDMALRTDRAWLDQLKRTA